MEHALAEIPLTHIGIGTDEEELVLSVLRSGHLVQGAMVERLEHEFARLTGVAHAVAVNSGTSALLVSLEALKLAGRLQEGDEVITSPFTFVATLNAVLQCGLQARFADIGRDFCLDPAAAVALHTDRARVVLPVHLYGTPADMPALATWASRAGLEIVEDAAQALGATVSSRPVGSYGLGCFSLYATKNVTSGEGGMVTTDDPGLAHIMGMLRNQGMKSRYDYAFPGHNLRMTDVHAAIGVGQMAKLSTINAVRRRNAVRLAEALDGVPGLRVPAEPPGRRSAWHLFTVRVTDDASLSRDDLASELHRLGIGTGIFYPKTVYDYDCFRNHPRVHLDPTPMAERAAKEVLSLPIHPAVGENEVDAIADAVRRLLHA